MHEDGTTRAEVDACEQRSWQHYQNRNRDSQNPRIGRAYKRRKIAADWAFQEAVREQRYNNDGYLWVPSICRCGSAGYGKGGVDIKRGDNGIHRRNISYCGGVSVCPCCSGLILRERSKELDEGIAHHMRTGGGVLMLTLTASHSRKDSLKSEIDVLQKAYKSTTRRNFNGLGDDAGIFGKVRRKETTYGNANGWHHHYHVLMFTERKLDAVEVECLEDGIYKRWEAALGALGWHADREHGISLEAARNVEQVGRYVSKELTDSGDNKTGKGSVSPFQLLDDPTQRNKRLWLEYVDAVKGMHVIQWDRGLKERLGVTSRTDAEIIEKLDEGEGERLLAKIEKRLYNLRRRDLTLMQQVEDAICARDYDHAAMLLGCSYSMSVIDLDTGELLPYFYME